MKSNFRRLLLVLFMAGLACIIFIVVLSFIFYRNGSLSETRRVEANTLVVEGWLPDYALEQALSEARSGNYDFIVTTGLNLPEYFEMNMNGYLIFNTRERFSDPAPPTRHTISVDCFSNMTGIYRSHINLYVNDTLISDFIVENKRQLYTSGWYGSLTEIDSVMVQFDNDDVGPWGDRNLFVKEVILDSNEKIGYQMNSAYDIMAADGLDRIENTMTSYSEMVRNKLVALGADTGIIYAVPGHKTRLNRTLSSVNAFNEWLNKSEIKVTGINVLSIGNHSKRSAMIYRKILDGNYLVGVVAVPENKSSYSKKDEALKTMRETIALIYYRLLLIFR